MGLWSRSFLFALVAFVVLVVAAAVRAAFERRRRGRLLPPGRAMGSLEYAFDVMHRVGGFVIVVVAKVEGPVELARLRRALDAIQAKHPLLRVHVGGPDGLFRAEGTRPIPLVAMTRKGRDQWLEVVHEELAHPLPYGADPLLKITWIHEPGVSAELLLTANHAVIDGVSAGVLLRDLFTAYADDAPSPPAPPGAAPSAVLPLDVGIEKYARLPRPKEPRPALLLPETPTDPAARQPVVVADQIAPAAMAALLQRCREKSTTLHGLLCASALFALAVEFGADRELSLSSNVSVRHELEPPVPRDSIGCFIGGVTTAHPIAADAELWSTARGVRDAITRSTAERNHLRWLATRFTWLHAFGVRRFLIKVNDGRLNALNVSNSGKLDIPSTYGPLRLSGVYFISSQHGVGSTFQVSVVSLAETLFLTFSWARPILSDDQASRIIATVQRVLARVVANESVTIAALGPKSPPSPRRKSV